ncbi:MAG TPA: SRPBCC domain-containing protein [Novosphingobium sp.]
MNTHLSLSRYIDAKPEKVWDVMVNRQEEWWCPAPWQAKIVEQDRRAGGVCNMVFHGPDGEREPQEGVYLAFEEGKRFVTTDAVQGRDFEPVGPFMVGYWQIEPEGQGTRYTAGARHWTEDAAKQHAEMGFEEGWGACADQLKALAEAQ